jgi:hypothetical protein
MTLQIVFKSTKAFNSTMNYVAVECINWSLTDQCLCVNLEDKVMYYPLTNVEVFYEVATKD